LVACLLGRSTQIRFDSPWWGERTREPPIEIWSLGFLWALVIGTWTFPFIPSPLALPRRPGPCVHTSSVRTLKSVIRHLQNVKEPCHHPATAFRFRKSAVPERRSSTLNLNLFPFSPATLAQPPVPPPRHFASFARSARKSCTHPQKTPPHRVSAPAGNYSLTVGPRLRRALTPSADIPPDFSPPPTAHRPLPPSTINNRSPAQRLPHA
jgi:hypothetical protein